MRTWAKSTSRAAVLTAGFVALGVSAIPANALADTTNGTASVLGGNQVGAPISAPADVTGNGASLIGSSYALSQGGAKVHKRGDGGGRTTSGVGGVASGNQVDAPVSAPVNVCGNGAGVLGHADAGCDGGAKVEDIGTYGRLTDGTGGVVAGNQVNAPVAIPANVCGNAVAVIGYAMAGCEGGSVVKNGGQTGSGQETSGLFGVVSGNQATAPISAPVDACGNAIGNATAFCGGGASVRGGGHRTGEQITDGTFGVISGNQADAPISIPATACGNAAAVIGLAAAGCAGGAGEGGPGQDDPYPHQRTGDSGVPLPLGQGPLGQGAAVLPKLDGAGPVGGQRGGDGSPGAVSLPNAGLPKGVDLVNATPGAGLVPGQEGVPVAASVLGAQNLPGATTLPVAGTALPGAAAPRAMDARDGDAALLDGGSLQAAHVIEWPKALLPVSREIPGVPGGDVLPAKPFVPSLDTLPTVSGASGIMGSAGGAGVASANGILGSVEAAGAGGVTGVVGEAPVGNAAAPLPLGPVEKVGRD
ncbi:MAG: chaplin family protein [Spirillospora sp.]